MDEQYKNYEVEDVEEVEDCEYDPSISADEARKRSENSEYLINKAFDEIKKASFRGLTRASVNIYQYPNFQLDKLVKTLKDAGYEVNLYSPKDGREKSYEIFW